MPTPRKIAVVEDLTAKMRSAAVVYFTDYRGLSAPKATELRAMLREQNIEFLVAKKTLTLLAAQKAGIGEISDFVQGQTALAFSYDDPTTPARILREFSKYNQDIPAITGLILEGQPLSAAHALELADLPARDVLLGRFVSALQQPTSRLVLTLKGAMAELERTLSSLREQKTS